ncbi:MAG TPA: aminotransferase class I/II-fold pyridoxal phosphate-dependent enzyme [Thermoanaerobaculia bacterium]|nr:aminotransferase class I/II-fold pyridoxal phosphate-dependent enzyme [Thermoanaerobaculia bacterium]
MQAGALSRRAFAQLLGAGAALISAPQLVAGNFTEPGRTARKSSGVVRLSSNENPYGPSAAALVAMREAFDLAWRYPDEHAEALIADLARLHGVAGDRVLIGDGSSEILKLAAAAYTGPDRKLVMADPTFEAIAFCAHATRAAIVKVPLDASYGHDLSKMLDAAKGAGLVYICNPNNPTASITPKSALRAFLDAVPATTMVLVDEAYHHYAESAEYESVIPLVAPHPNLIVSRTFSKIFGMAGLRLGYAVAQPAAIQRLGEEGVWDSVNIMAIAAARASIGDAQHVALGKKRNRETKARLCNTLDGLGYRYIPSEANFLMIDLRRDVKPVIGAMKAKRVEVGRLFPPLPHHLRITIGTPEQMDAFVAAFKDVMAA